MNEKAVGKCSLCGGLVTVPTVFWSVVPPTPTCQKCGAVMDVAATLPTVPMKPHGRPSRAKPRFRKPRLQCTVPLRAMSLAEYDRLHDNGCSICRDPNCTDPGGKH